MTPTRWVFSRPADCPNIVTTLQRGNAVLDALRPILNARGQYDSRLRMFIVPMLRVGMPFWTLCVQS
ncbi:hypothetical protein CXB39_11640 [Pseudomonas amygdali pv. morsprunorum]|nr:hypothetical protein CXB39_11640 [Pseudomonas amygdali pv. morsprunorum]